MRQLMQLIQQEYGCPVDIEFTMNLSDTGEYSVNLLQCRPLQVFRDTAAVVIPEDVPEDRIVLESMDSSMGLSRCVPLDLIVYVDPKAYYNLPYAEKPKTAALIGKINWALRDSGRHMMLIVPGRIGTSSPELGVPAPFSDISGFEVICEVEETEAGYNPELSYGSHIFQDLVEAQILYTAVFAKSSTLRYAPDILEACPDIAPSLLGTDQADDVIRAYDLSGAGCTLYYDLEKNHLLLRMS